MANMNSIQQMIFPDENAPFHRKKSVTAASVKSKGNVVGQKKPGGARKALNDITNKSGVVQAKATSKNKQIASAVAAKDDYDIAGEMFLHDHSKCIKAQQKLLDDHFSADLIPLHNDSSIKGKHLNHYIENMEAKDKLSYEEPEEIGSAKLIDWRKSSTPWRSPISRGSMMPSTPLAWRFDSTEFTLTEDSDLF